MLCCRRYPFLTMVLFCYIERSREKFLGGYIDYWEDKRRVFSGQRMRTCMRVQGEVLPIG